MPVHESTAEARRSAKNSDGNPEERVRWWMFLIDASQEIVLGAEIAESTHGTISRICAFHGDWAEIWADEGLKLGLGRWRYRAASACDAPWFDDAVASATPNLRHRRLPRNLGGVLSHAAPGELEFNIEYGFFAPQRIVVGAAHRRLIRGEGHLSIAGCSAAFSGVGEVGTCCYSPISSADPSLQTTSMIGLGPRSDIVGSGSMTVGRTADGIPIHLTVPAGARIGGSARCTRFHSFASLPGSTRVRFILCAGNFRSSGGRRGVGWLKTRMPLL